MHQTKEIYVFCVFGIVAFLDQLDFASIRFTRLLDTHTPGTSPAPIMRKDPTEGADAHAALLQKQKFANAYRAFLAGEANPYNAMLAENTSGSLLTRVESVLPMSPKRTVGGGVVKFQRAASLVSRVLSVAKGTAREDVGESESGVCGGRGELVCPIRVTRSCPHVNYFPLITV